MLWVLITSIVLICILILAGAWLGTPLVLRGLQTRALLNHCEAGGMIALTYDDGPSPEVTPRILDMLDELQVKATLYSTQAEAQRD